MTREELKEHCQRQIQNFERVEKIMPVTPNDWKRYEEHKLILELLEQEPILDKIRAEIEKTTSRYTISRERGAMGQVEWSDRLIKESEVLEIIDKYKAESDHKCHNCKHYTSGERDGSCDSYICKNYSGWERKNEE